jgi:kinetochore protein Spc24
MLATKLRLSMRVLRACCRHQLSLYAHVSRITWQFERRDRVAGTVSNPLRTFDFDPATAEFDSVNALWDLMGTDE